MDDRALALNALVDWLVVAVDVADLQLLMLSLVGGKEASDSLRSGQPTKQWTSHFVQALERRRMLDSAFWSELRRLRSLKGDEIDTLQATLAVPEGPNLGKVRVRQEARLASLLSTAFTSDELQQALWRTEWGNAVLPALSPDLALAELVQRCVHSLQQRGSLQAEFFELLRELRPRYLSEINGLERPFVGATTPAPVAEDAFSLKLQPPVPASVEPSSLFAIFQESADTQERCKHRPLDAKDIDEILTLLGPLSRPLRSLVNRLPLRSTARGPYQWFMQERYRTGNLDFDGDPGAARALAPSHRLVALSTDSQGLEFPVLLIVVRRGHRHGRRSLQPQVERVLVDRSAALDGLIGGKAHLMMVPVEVSLPRVRPKRFIVWTFPYRCQEQERLSCLLSALWMAFAYLRFQVGHRKVPIDEMLLRARPSRSSTDNGLRLDEAVEIIRGADLAPHVYWVDRREESGAARAATRSHMEIEQPSVSQYTWLKPMALVEAMHSYIDSQLQPPMLHAVVVVGHPAYETQSQAHGEGRSQWNEALGFATTTELLEEIVVHDDDIGPFMRMAVWGGGCLDFDQKTHLYGESVAHSAVAMFVPLPIGVRLVAEHAMLIVRSLLRSPDWSRLYDLAAAGAADGHDKALKELVESYKRARDGGQFVVSLYLDRSARLRSNCARSAQPTRPDLGRRPAQVRVGGRSVHPDPHGTALRPRPDPR